MSNVKMSGFSLSALRAYEKLVLTDQDLRMEPSYVRQSIKKKSYKLTLTVSLSVRHFPKTKRIESMLWEYKLISIYTYIHPMK